MLETQKARSQNQVYILNPYVPAYRVKFFTDLEAALRKKDITLTLLTGRPKISFRRREDSASVPFHHEKKQLNLSILRFNFRYLRVGRDLSGAKAVVYEFSITNLNTWLALIGRRYHKVMIWGHGPGYLSRENRVRLFLQRQMAIRADHVLTYTEEGRKRTIALGVSPKKVTSVNNTIDTSPITAGIKGLSDSEIKAFLVRHSLSPNNKVFAYIGALDSTKRISFLEKLLDELWSIDQTTRLIVGGAGPLKYKLKKSIERGQTIYLGRVQSEGKAILSKTALGIINPGNTGLVAVDALAMRVPIFGTDTLSSPEKGYLTEGNSFYTLPNDPKQFAIELLDLIRTKSLVKVSGQIPMHQDFVDKFAREIENKVLSSRKTKLLWITNLPAPYRLSLFESLSEKFELTVGYTGWRAEGRSWKAGGPQNDRYDTVQVGRLFGIGRIKMPFSNSRMRNVIYGSDFVVVGGWHSPAFMNALKLAKRNKISSALWFESTLDSARFNAGPIAVLRKYAFSIPNVILVPGSAAKTAALLYSGGKAPIFELTNPISKTYLEAEASNSTSLDSRGTKYLFFGRLLGLKKINLLISAFEEVARDWDRLTIVGDGPRENKLKNQAARSSKSDQVFFQPAVPDSQALGIYNQHDVLVLPSSREVWGMVIAEALVLGLRAIGSSSVGASKTFLKFSTFQMFQSGSVHALAAALDAARVPVKLSVSERRELLNLNSPEVFSSKLSRVINDFLKGK